MRTLLKNGLVVTMDDARRVLRGGSVLLDGDAIAGVFEHGAAPEDADVAIDLRGHALLPGFVQTHVHGCQTLFRGAADDLPLLEWLKHRIWPLEAAHDEDSLAASIGLTVLELLAGGTTAALTMETVRHTDAAIAAYEASPLRAVVGKCMMDTGDGVPRALLEDTKSSLEESLTLLDRHPATRGRRVRACFAPRFAVSCSEGLLRDVASEAGRRGALVHTHCAEQVAEVELVLRLTGRRNLSHLDHVGLLRPFLRIAHAVHLDEREVDLLAASGAHVLHCPSSNLKLGSGIAPIVRYLDRGIPVSLGADGAPCNNNLDALREARLAALLQKPLFGPTALDARTALERVTRAGAASLGMEDEIGSITAGRHADLVEIDLDTPHVAPGGDVYSDIVYGAERADIRRVFAGGAVVIENGIARYGDAPRIIARAREQARALFRRAGIVVPGGGGGRSAGPQAL